MGIAQYRENEKAKRIQYLEAYKDIFNSGGTLQEIADKLNRENIKTPNGGKWHKVQVGRSLDTLDIPRRRW